MTNVVCYFTSWTVYRPDNGKFDVSSINPSLCTHINYAFVGLGEDGTVNILDDWEANGLKELQHLVDLKKQNPNLKILVSMGGWNEGSGKYSQLAKDPTKRKTLANNVLQFIQKYHFDGFDLDWEYPGQRDGSDPANDPTNFIALLTDLRAVLKPRGYLLTVAVAGGPTSIDKSYNVPALSNTVDMINVMAYDFHGSFEPFVGHHCPLYPSSADKTSEQRSLNVSSGIQHWLNKGADPRKINLGLGTYGRSFTLANPANTALYAPTTGGGTAGPYTRQEGILGFNEICEFDSSWTYVWDSEQKVPHKISGSQWVGYEDEKSIALKVQYGKSKNLGGFMVWSLDTDNFRGIGGPKYSLLTVVNKNL